jgi:hypothetical protein
MGTYLLRDDSRVPPAAVVSRVPRLPLLRGAIALEHVGSGCIQQHLVPSLRDLGPPRIGRDTASALSG